MSKEFMKLGPISCSIQAEPPYKEVRNGNTDFTLAKEKPALAFNVVRVNLDSGHVAYKASSLKFSVRVNDIGDEILKMCTGKNTIEKIAYDIAENHDFDDDEFLEQVKTFLNIFRTYKLL